MTLPTTYPSRIWLCPGCQKPFNERWLLARHLRQVHQQRKTIADDIAFRAEYLLAPRYFRRAALRVNPDDYFQQDKGERG